MTNATENVVTLAAVFNCLVGYGEWENFNVIRKRVYLLTSDNLACDG
jgi:hypothetical protein